LAKTQNKNTTRDRQQQHHPHFYHTLKQGFFTGEKKVQSPNFLFKIFIASSRSCADPAHVALRLLFFP
jgi:hypothetical protein